MKLGWTSLAKTCGGLRTSHGASRSTSPASGLPVAELGPASTAEVCVTAKAAMDACKQHNFIWTQPLKRPKHYNCLISFMPSCSQPSPFKGKLQPGFTPLFDARTARGQAGPYIDGDGPRAALQLPLILAAGQQRAAQLVRRNFKPRPVLGAASLQHDRHLGAAERELRPQRAAAFLADLAARSNHTIHSVQLLSQLAADVRLQRLPSHEPAVRERG